jgi:hypothetical protein
MPSVPDGHIGGFSSSGRQCEQFKQRAAVTDGRKPDF